MRTLDKVLQKDAGWGHAAGEYPLAQRPEIFGCNRQPPPRPPAQDLLSDCVEGDAKLAQQGQRFLDDGVAIGVVPQA